MFLCAIAADKVVKIVSVRGLKHKKRIRYFTFTEIGGNHVLENVGAYNPNTCVVEPIFAQHALEHGALLLGWIVLDITPIDQRRGTKDLTC